jgi:hypothetical protein
MQMIDQNQIRKKQEQELKLNSKFWVGGLNKNKKIQWKLLQFEGRKKRLQNPVNKELSKFSHHRH